MKKFIIMSLAFVALALVGCNRKSDEDKCKEKADHEWVDGECKKKAPAQNQADCEKPGTMKWVATNEVGKQCVAKTQTECTGENVEWKEDKCVAKAEEAKATYSIRNAIPGRVVTVKSGSAEQGLLENVCVLVTADQVAALKVTVKADASDATKPEEVLCNSEAETPANTDNDCQAKNGIAKVKENAPAAGATGMAANKHELDQRDGVQTPTTCTAILGAPAS